MDAVVPGLIFAGIGIVVALGGWFTLADPRRAAMAMRNSATVRKPDDKQEQNSDLFVRRARALGWAAVGAGVLLFLLGAFDVIRTLIVLNG
jgi:hypothetical protein